MQLTPRSAALAWQAWGLASTSFVFQITALVVTVLSMEEPSVGINKDLITVVVDNVDEEDKSEMHETDGLSDRAE